MSFLKLGFSRQSGADSPHKKRHKPREEETEEENIRERITTAAVSAVMEGATWVADTRWQEHDAVRVVSQALLAPTISQLLWLVLAI